MTHFLCFFFFHSSDFDKLNKTDVYYNNDLAFRTAEMHLGVPALLDAADMASYSVPDRLSILTYLSQFYQLYASQGEYFDILFFLFFIFPVFFFFIIYFCGRLYCGCHASLEWER